MLRERGFYSYKNNRDVARLKVLAYAQVRD